VLQGLQQKSFLEAETVIQIEEVLKEREIGTDIGMSSPAKDGADLGDMPPSQTIPKAGRGGSGSGNSGPQRLDKKQIEQRIEEDRERHKRLRENIWAVPKGDDAEMWKIWEETSDLGEDDHIMGEEELLEYERTVRMSCPHRDAEHTSNGKHSRLH